MSTITTAKRTPTRTPTRTFCTDFDREIAPYRAALEELLARYLAPVADVDVCAAVDDLLLVAAGAAVRLSGGIEIDEDQCESDDAFDLDVWAGALS